MTAKMDKVLPLAFYSLMWELLAEVVTEMEEEAAIMSEPPALEEVSGDMSWGEM